MVFIATQWRTGLYKCKNGALVAPIDHYVRQLLPSYIRLPVYTRDMRKILAVAVLGMILFGMASAQTDARNGVMDRVSDIVDRVVQTVTERVVGAAAEAYTPELEVQMTGEGDDAQYEWTLESETVATTTEPTVRLENVPDDMSVDLSFGDNIDGFSIHTAQYGGNDASHEKKLWGRVTSDDTPTVNVGDWIKDIQAGKADEGRKEIAVVLSVYDDTPELTERTDVPDEANTYYMEGRGTVVTGQIEQGYALTKACVPGDDGCAADGYSMTVALGAKKDGKVKDMFPPNVQMHGGGDTTGDMVGGLVGLQVDSDSGADGDVATESVTVAYDKYEREQ